MTEPPLRRLLPGVRRGDAVLAAVELELDVLDVQVALEGRLAWRELAPKLRALGLNPGREPRLPHPLEQRSSRHADIDDLRLARAQLRASKRGRIVRTTGHVLRVR